MKYLGIDLGSKTLGLAIGQGIIASSWKTLRFNEHNFNHALSLLLPEIEQYQPTKIILGFPLNMDGSVGQSAQAALEFKALLASQISKEIEIILIDERRSTFSAKQLLINANLTRKKQKQVKDQVAATIILQTYFDKINMK